MDIGNLIARVTVPRPAPDGPTGAPGGFKNELDRIRSGEPVDVQENKQVQVEAGANGQARFDTPVHTIFKNSTITGDKDAPNTISVAGSGNTLIGGNVGSSNQRSDDVNTLFASGSDNKLVAGDAGTVLSTQSFTANDGAFKIPATGNELLGGKGADLLIPSAGDKVVSGGAGDDTVKLQFTQGFNGSPAEVVAQLAKFAQFEGGEGNDTLLLPLASGQDAEKLKGAYETALKEQGLWDKFETIKWEGGTYEPEVVVKSGK